MRYLLSLPAALALALGCGDNGPTTPTDPMAALAGSWAIQTWELRDVNNAANRADRIAAGFGGTLTVAASGAFTVSLTFLGQPVTESQTGTLTIDGDTLVFHTADGDVLIRFSTAGGTMTWDTLEPEVFDLDGDEVEDHVVEHMVFQRS
jgi:hypothetical protein